MQSFDFLTELQNLFSPQEIKVALSAFRQDQLVWGCLGSKNFFETARARFGGDLKMWSPARLAMIEITHLLAQEGISFKLSDPMNPKVERFAFQVFEELADKETCPQNLTDAGWVALALWKKLKDDQSLALKQVLDFTSIANNKRLAFYQTPLACLVGLVEEPILMLSSILNDSEEDAALQLVAHALLSQPQSLQELSQVFLKLFIGLNERARLGWLNYLVLSGRDELVEKLAGLMLEELTAEKEIKPDLLLDTKKLAKSNEDPEYIAGLYQFSNQPYLALPWLQYKRQALQNQLAGVDLKIANTYLQRGDKVSAEKYLDDLENLSPQSDEFQSDWCTMGGKRLSDERLKAAQPRIQNPISQIYQAGWLSDAGEHLEAVKLGQEAVTKIENLFQQGVNVFKTHAIWDWNPASLVEILLKIGLEKEAYELATLIMRLRPVDTQLLSIASRLAEKLGDKKSALEYTQVLATLDPSNCELHRRLADLWEALEAWDKSMTERSRVVDMSENKESKDLVSLAQSAFNNMQFGVALQACDTVLAKNPENDRALTLKAKTLMKRGDFEGAARSFNQAILLAPESEDAWLGMADLQEKVGGSQRAIETLKAGYLASPGSLKLMLTIAAKFLSLQLPSEALPYLRSAMKASPDSAIIALKLGKTLLNLGYTKEARQVFETAWQKWPFHPDLGFAYAQVLIDMGEYEKALPALEVALHTDTPDVERYISYTLALLDNEKITLSEKISISPLKLETACRALQKALIIQPQNFTVRLLMADVLFAKGEYNDAFEIYRQLEESKDSLNIEESWRVKIGLGRTALKLNKVEAALASLQDVAQALPDVLIVLQLLAEAYQRAHLCDEAVCAAKNALRLAPDSISTLNWFADLMEKMNEYETAANSLERLIQLMPDCPDYVIQLAQVNVSQGDLDAARNQLDRVFSKENLSIHHLTQLAHVYLRIQDTQSALNCLNHALAITTAPSVELLIETSILDERIGNLPAALEKIQQAILLAPKDPELYLFQADLMEKVGLYPAALESLDNMKRLQDRPAVSLQQSAPKETSKQVFNFVNLINKEPKYISRRLTRLYYRVGDLRSALESSEQALSESPDDFDLRYFTADLAAAQLLHDVTDKTLTLPADLSSYFEDEENEALLQSKLDLISLKAENFLEQGFFSEANQLVEAALPFARDISRLLGVKARILFHKGDRLLAFDLYEKITELESLVTPKNLDKREDPISSQFWRKAQRTWLAKTALDAHDWKTALSLFEQMVTNFPEEPRTQLNYAQAMVICAEEQLFCDEVKCVTHAPGKDVLNPDLFDGLEKSILLVTRYLSNPKLCEWLARGEAVYRPDLQGIQALVSLPEDGNIIAAQMAAFRRVGRENKVIVLAQDYIQNPEVLIQLALCLKTINPKKGLEVAQKLTEILPQEPLFHVLTALLAQQCGENDLAYQSLEAALQIWGDEPEWQSWAGELAKKAGLVNTALEHYEKALELQPGASAYAIELGRIYLAKGAALKAIKVLQKACEGDSHQLQAVILLGHGYRKIGRFSAAVECIQKAETFSPDSIDAVILKGETLLDMGKVVDAQQIAENLISRVPGNKEAILLLSHVLNKQGNLQKALTVLGESQPGVSEDWQIGFERARLIRRLRGSPASLTILKNLVQESPNQVEVLALMAKVQAECGDFSAAEATAYQALRLQPDFVDMNLFLGRLQNRSGQLDKSVHSFIEAIRQAPDEIDAYLELGQVYQKRREPLLALKIYQQAMKTKPQDYRSFYQAALILRERKDYQGAEILLKKASELAPDDLNIGRQFAAVVALNLVHQSQEA